MLLILAEVGRFPYSGSGMGAGCCVGVGTGISVGSGSGWAVGVSSVLSVSAGWKGVGALESIN